MTAAPRSSVIARLGYGIVLPAALLLAYVLVLVFAAGRGREWAPVVVLLYSLAAVPAAMLANAWILFLDLPRGKLVLAGLAVPAYVAVALTVYQLGSGGEGNVGLAMLAPYIRLLEAADGRWALLLLAWLVAMTMLLVAAVWRERGLKLAATRPSQ